MAPESGDHVEGTEALLGGAVRDQDGVDKTEDEQKRRLGPVAGERQHEGGGERLVLI